MKRRNALRQLIELEAWRVKEKNVNKWNESSWLNVFWISFNHIRMLLSCETVLTFALVPSFRKIKLRAVLVSTCDLVE